MKRGRECEDDDRATELFRDISTRISRSVLIACRLDGRTIECAVQQPAVEVFNRLLGSMVPRAEIDKYVRVYVL
jgi:hypothetical protein